jgi:hypothetical protein
MEGFLGILFYCIEILNQREKFKIFAGLIV